MDYALACDVETLVEAASKWGEMIEGLRERGQLVQTLRDAVPDYRVAISSAAERVREATR